MHVQPALCAHDPAKYFPAPAPRRVPSIGIALGGGFARAIAHIGVLRVLERAGIPISGIAGISAGAMVAAAYASGTNLDEIAALSSSMRFTDVARWSLSKMGLARSARTDRFLRRLLKRHRLEEMRVPLCVVATDLLTGAPASFFGTGDVIAPVRASCAYPGLLEPVQIGDRLYVDGAIAMDIPASPLRNFNVDKIIAVRLACRSTQQPSNFFAVVNRCFRIMNERSEEVWRPFADLVVEPDVSSVEWNGFADAPTLIESGELAALAALPKIREWLQREEDSRAHCIGEVA